MAAIAIGVKLSSPGPVLFRQRRYGLDGKRIVIYKFRTMVEEAEKDTGPVWASPEDPRRTPIGIWLRRFKWEPRAVVATSVVVLAVGLTLFVRERQLGEVLAAPMDVVLDFEAALVVQPDVLFLGEKDAQQLAVVRRSKTAEAMAVRSAHPRRSSARRAS